MKKHFLIFKALSPLAFHGISGHSFHSGLSPDITMPRDPVTGLPVFYGVKGAMRDALEDHVRYVKFSHAILFGIEMVDGLYRVYSDEVEDGYQLKDEWLCRWEISEDMIWKGLYGDNYHEMLNGAIPLSRILEVVSRNKVDEKGVAENIWTEEELPEGSILVAVAWGEDRSVLDRFQDKALQLHIGGGITVGRGRGEVRMDG